MDAMPSRQEAVILRLFGRGIILYVNDDDQIRAKVPKGEKIHDSDRAVIDDYYRQIQGFLKQDEKARIASVFYLIESLAEEFPDCHGCVLSGPGETMFGIGSDLIELDGAAFVVGERQLLDSARRELKAHDHGYVQGELNG